MSKEASLPLRESIPADCGMDETLPRHEGNEARRAESEAANLKLRPKLESFSIYQLPCSGIS